MYYLKWNRYLVNLIKYMLKLYIINVVNNYTTKNNNDLL